MKSLRPVGMLVALVSLALAGCGTPTGSERGACYPNATCDPGLSCLSNLCVRTTGDATSGADATGTDGAANDTGSMDSADALPTNDTPPVDTGGDTTSADAPVDSPSTTDGGACTAAGVECSGYATALGAAPRGATSLDNCVVQLHQTDCCGATRAYGANHAARDTLCPAESACVAMYPAPAGCSDPTITTDSGETTTNMSEVKLRIVSPMPCSFDNTQTCYTCETFVCRTGSCSSAPGIAGGCGP